MGRTQTLTLLTSPNGLKKCDNEWDEERAKRSCTKKSIMSLKEKKWWKASISVRVSKGVIKSSCFGYDSRCLSTHPCFYVCLFLFLPVDLLGIYTLELYVAQSIPFLDCENASQL